MMPLLLAAIVMTPDRLPGMPCSTVYGCEIRLLPGETVQQVSVTDPRWQTVVLASGPMPAARIKVLPGPANGGRAEVDASTNLHSYRVVVTATERATSMLLQYEPDPTPPPAKVVYLPPPAPVPTPVGEIAALRPSEMDSVAWRSEGGVKCDTVFGVPDRGQVWCYLPASIRKAPAVYHTVGRAHAIVNSRVLRGNLLVIDSLDSPLDAQFGDGTSLTIIRGNH
jgi:hypothetical protein